MANKFEQSVINSVARDTLTNWHKKVIDVQDSLAVILSEIDKIEDKVAKILLKNKIETVAMYACDAAEDLECILEEYPETP